MRGGDSLRLVHSANGEHHWPMRHSNSNIKVEKSHTNGLFKFFSNPIETSDLQSAAGRILAPPEVMGESAAMPVIGSPRLPSPGLATFDAWDVILLNVSSAQDDESPATIVFTADHVTSDGLAVYAYGVIDLKKDLEAEGITVALADPPDRRVYRHLYSATSDPIIQFAISLASGGVILAIQSLAKIRGNKEVRITATRRIHRGSETVEEELTYEGTARKSVDVVKIWKDQSSSDV